MITTRTAFILAAAVFMPASSTIASESYRLVHAIGNEEKTIAKDLDRDNCQRMKKDRSELAALLGTGGSITCLPESLFKVQ